MGNLTLAALGKLFSANPLTANGPAATTTDAAGKDATAADFTQLLAGFQAGQAAGPGNPATVTGEMAAGQSPAAETSATPVGLSLPDQSVLLAAGVAATAATDATAAQSALPDSNLLSLVMTSLPSAATSEGGAASGTPSSSASEEVANTTPASDANAADPARQAADLLALLGLPVTPLPVQPAQANAASAGDARGGTADLAISLAGGTVARPADAGSAGSAGPGITGQHGSQNTQPGSPELSLADLLKPTGNAQAPALHDLSRNMAAMADALSRRAASQGTDVGSTPGNAPSLILTPLAQATGVTTLQAAAPTTATVTVQLPGHMLNDPGWADAFRERVGLLAGQGVQHASISVTPDDMGPIHVRIAMADQAAQVEFKAQHHATAALIESLLPRLASSLESQGIRLDDARVATFSAQDEAALQSSLQQDGRQAASQQASGREQRFAATLGEQGGEVAPGAGRVTAPAPRSVRKDSALDAYA